MQLKAVKRLRDEALARVHLSVSQRWVLPYELAGGHQTPNPWQAVGFYSKIKERTRVVFELLRTASASGVLLRVYREEPLQVVYSSVIGDPGVQQHLDAAEVFLDAVAGEALEDLVAARHAVERVLAPGWRHVLYPLPPPVSPEERPGAN